MPLLLYSRALESAVQSGPGIYTLPCVADDNIQELAAELVQLGFISEVSGLESQAGT